MFCVLNTPWLDRERSYQEPVARRREAERFSKDVGWLKEVPLAGLVKRTRPLFLSPHRLLLVAVLAPLVACGTEKDSTPALDREHRAAEAIATNATLVDVMADDCHVYPTSRAAGAHTRVYGTRCSLGARVISSTHETEGLGLGDMFALDPPPDGTYTASAPWNVTYRPHFLDLALDNRSALHPGLLSNNGRLIYDGYLGTFLNISISRALSSDTLVHLVFEDQGSVLETGSAARVTLGTYAVDDTRFLHWVETNLRVAGRWDYCTAATGPSSQIKGTPLGLSTTESCDPTSNAVVDYRSYNAGSSELFYLNGPRLLPPAISGTRMTYNIPVSALYAALPWKVVGPNMKLGGLYFGIEHHRGVKTRVVLEELRIIDGSPTSTHAAAIDRMRRELVAPAIPALKGTLDDATPLAAGFHLRGWACTDGVNGQTEVHIRARQRGATGIGSFIRAITTTSSSSYSTSACRNSGSNVYDITLPSWQAAPYLGQEVIIVAKNNADGSYGVINAPSSLGIFRAYQAPAPAPPPSSVVEGLLDFAVPVSCGFRVYGWACTVGVSGKTEIHLRARPPGTSDLGTWLGTFSTTGSSTYSTRTCRNNGTDVFDVTLSRATITPFLGQEVVIVAKSNADGSYHVINTPSSSVVFR